MTVIALLIQFMLLLVVGLAGMSVVAELGLPRRVRLWRWVARRQLRRVRQWAS